MITRRCMNCWTAPPGRPIPKITTERYAGISRGIDLKGIALKEVALETKRRQGVASLAVRLETSTVGVIPVNYSVELSCAKDAPWLLKWHPGLIFPELSGNRKVDLKRRFRGVITDRNGEILPDRAFSGRGSGARPLC